jgi:hypothetical protein
VWTSDKIRLQQTDKYVFVSMNAKFDAKELGIMEDSDIIEIKMRPCRGGWRTSKGLKNDFSRNTRKPKFTTFTGNWLISLDNHHDSVHVQVILKSDRNYREQHMFVSLQIFDKGCPVAATPTNAPTSAPTNFPTKTPTAACTVQCSTTSGLLLVSHDATSGHSTHRCYQDPADAEECKCECQM